MTKKDKNDYKSLYFNDRNVPTLEELHSLTCDVLDPTDNKWNFRGASSIFRDRKTTWKFEHYVENLEKTKDYKTVPGHFRFWLDKYVEHLLAAYYCNNYSIRFEKGISDKKADKQAVKLEKELVKLFE